MKTILTIAFLFLFAFAAVAQEKPPAVQPTPTPKAEETKPAETKLTAKDYEDLLDKLKKGDTNIDFVKLRLAYTETKDYSPYGGSEERNKMFEALKKEEYKNALKIAEKFLETNYVDLHAHYVATIANQKLNKTKEADFHKAVFEGLMKAITVNDGKTAKTGMISIGISEQYFVMSYFGFQRQSKALTREEGSMFDVHTAYNAETKETRKFYFNIDKVFGRF